MHFALCQAIEAELLSEEVPDGYSKRAKALFEQLREEFGWIESGQTTVLVDSDHNATWWTFAGTIFNAAMADVLGDLAGKVSSDNLAVSLSKVVDTSRLLERIRLLLDSEEGAMVEVPLDAGFVQELKFSECLPQELVDGELSSRYCCAYQHEKLSERRVGMINSYVHAGSTAS
jgi:ATP-dependent Lhr-like helicase